MKNVCLLFNVHQPFRLRNFPFTRIGDGGTYFDGRANEGIMRKVARNCYLPANQLLLKLIRKYRGRFRVAFSISGTALDQFEMYMPEVTESFKALADTGCVEFLAGTYAHSLAVLKSEAEFRRQVLAHVERTERLFMQRPVVFRNTELICSDQIAGIISSLGFTAMISNGVSPAPQVTGTCQVYNHHANSPLKILMKHATLSDDISARFSDSCWPEWPLTAEKFTGWLQDVPDGETPVNLFMDYETFGEHHAGNSGIFRFLEALPGEICSSGKLRFVTPAEAAGDPATATEFSFSGSHALSALPGNDLQQDAFNSLYALEAKVAACNDGQLKRNWLYLQSSDHFHYMNTRTLDCNETTGSFSPYNNPFDAFVNYMNVLTDFSLRLDKSRSQEKIKPNVHGYHAIETGLHI
jgi:alpha-amylase